MANSRPNDPDYLKQRRAIVRAYHPDRGGSPEQLDAALKELDRRWGIVTSGSSSGQTASHGASFASASVVMSQTPLVTRFLQSVMKKVKRGSTTIRTHMPRKMPGAVRYATTGVADSRRQVE